MKKRNAILAATAGTAGIAAVAAIVAKRGEERDSGLRQVAAFDHQVTGVTVTPDNRIFVNFPRWTDDAPVSVAELGPDGTIRPYPDAQWNAYRNARANDMAVEEHFVCVQSVVADGRGALWVLDPAAPGNEKILPGGPKLVKIDLASDSVARVYRFAGDVALQGTYLNDVRLSPDGETAYITDSGTRGAIIVVDLSDGSAFRALDGHAATQPEKDVTVTVDGAPLRRPDGRQPMFAADGIALSADGAYLYFQALTGRTLYRIATDRLRRDAIDAIPAALETLGQTHVADGLWMRADGRLYVTSPGDDSVRRWNGTGTDRVVADRRLRWPDTMSEGPDGMLYVTASHIQDTNWFRPSAPASLPTTLFAFRDDG